MTEYFQPNKKFLSFMVFTALYKVYNSNKIPIMSKLCHKKDIEMSPEHFVEDVLCKDPEFKNILDNHRYHGERTKEW